MWRFIIHIPTIHNNRLFLSCCFFCCSDKANYFHKNRKTTVAVRHVTQLTHTNVHAERDNICHFIYVHSRPNKSPFNFNCVDTDSAMGHERRHISLFSIFSTSIFTTRRRSHCIFKFYLFLWKRRWKRRKLWITETKNLNFMFLLMKIVWKKTK